MRRSRPEPRTRERCQYVAARCAYLIFLGFPLLWLISTSFKPPQELVRAHPTLLPQHPDSGPTTRTPSSRQGLAAGRAQQPAGLARLTTLLPCSSRCRWPTRWPASAPARPVAIGWVLVSQVFPVILIVIPLFLILRTLHLTNTLAGLVMVYVVWSLPFALWMLQGYVAAVPRELEEAAAVDGAGRLRTLVAS